MPFNVVFELCKAHWVTFCVKRAPLKKRLPCQRYHHKRLRCSRFSSSFIGFVSYGFPKTDVGIRANIFDASRICWDHFATFPGEYGRRGVNQSIFVSLRKQVTGVMKDGGKGANMRRTFWLTCCIRLRVWSWVRWQAEQWKKKVHQAAVLKQDSEARDLELCKITFVVLFKKENMDLHMCVCVCVHISDRVWLYFCLNGAKRLSHFKSSRVLSLTLTVKTTFCLDLVYEKGRHD